VHLPLDFGHLPSLWRLRQTSLGGSLVAGNAKANGLEERNWRRVFNLPTWLVTDYKWLRCRNLRALDRPPWLSTVPRQTSSSCLLIGVFIPPISLSRRSRSGTDWSSSTKFVMVSPSSCDHFYKSLRNSWVYSRCIVDALSTLTAYWLIIDYCCRTSICLYFSLMSCCICLEDLNSPVSLPCGVSIMVTFASPFVDNLNRACFLLWVSQESCSGDSTLFDPSCMSNMSHTLFYRYISTTLLVTLHVQRVL